VILSASEARVTVEIQQIDTTYTFEQLAIEVRGQTPGYEYSLSTDRVDVTIRGNPGRVSEITADLVRPQVDLTGLGPGTHSVPVSVGLPSGVRKDQVTPANITVVITEASDGTAGDGSGNSDRGNNGSGNPE